MKQPSVNVMYFTFNFSALYYIIVYSYLIDFQIQTTKWRKGIKIILKASKTQLSLNQTTGPNLHQNLTSCIEKSVEEIRER